MANEARSTLNRETRGPEVSALADAYLADLDLPQYGMVKEVFLKAYEMGYLAGLAKALRQARQVSREGDEAGCREAQAEFEVEESVDENEEDSENDDWSGDVVSAWVETMSPVRQRNPFFRYARSTIPRAHLAALAAVEPGEIADVETGSRAALVAPTPSSSPPAAAVRELSDLEPRLPAVLADVSAGDSAAAAAATTAPAATTTTTTTAATPTTAPAATTSAGQRDSLYGIPLAYTIVPIDVQALRKKGPTVAENPYRVVIGPVSDAAREAWKGDRGKAYLHKKLGGDRRSGLHLCQMLRAHDGTFYVLAMFASQQYASKTVELMGRGYPCGGSIMWAWTCPEEE
ncbi:uncharacterized protein B0T15DRAFT_511201 [Chaetomium strumarium]|uniref:Uncharacterized protein n=1 Tax=Chaetomium strumarium TaxID=1170767 RepID=A0AAJ0M183_9PEZI|nr:hypothetical protein B0T15DRAFT_511201 [Chaetomium strumarium]